MDMNNLQEIRNDLIADFLSIIAEQQMVVERDFLHVDLDFFLSDFGSYFPNRLVKNIQEVSEILADRLAYYWFIRFLMVYVLEINHCLPKIINGISFSGIKNNSREHFITVVKTLEVKIAPSYYPFWQPNFENYLTDEIWKKLLSLPERFNWDVELNFSSDGKIENIGKAFEKFNKHTKEKNKGADHEKESALHSTQYYTPRELSENMAQNTIGRMLVERDLKKLYGEKGLSHDKKILKEKEIAESRGWTYYFPLSNNMPETEFNDLQKIKIIEIKVQTLIQFSDSLAA